jgi:Tol biopolymer transport system component
MKRILILVLVFACFPAAAQDAPAVTVTEAGRIERSAGPRNTSAHLSPDGTRILHVEQDTFCVLTAEGDEQSCHTASEQTGLRARDSSPDHDSIAWSPDGRYAAYTTMGLQLGTDTDIWVLDTESGIFTNATDDGYDGSVITGELPDDLFIDLAPAWMPDGTLTFARHTLPLRETALEVWSVSPSGAVAMPVAELHAPTGEGANVMSLDWSADGSTLAYVIYALNASHSGAWVYDADSGETKQVIGNDDAENLLRADLSPDGTHLLALSAERMQFMLDQERDGHFVVPVDSGEVQRLDPQRAVINAGWLPDGRLLYIGRSIQSPDDSGLYVTSDPTAVGQKVMDMPEHDGAAIPVFAPTNRSATPLNIAPNGLLLLGTPAEFMIVLEVEFEAPAAQTEATPEPGEPAAQASPAALTARELLRLPLLSAPAASSSHISPDGQHVTNVRGHEFCLYTIGGVQQWCVEVIDRLNDDRPVRPDSESIRWSPDGRYLAFTIPVYTFFRDADIWVVDLEEATYTNLTEDGYDGGIALRPDVPETVTVDLAPAWTPDSRLTFVRYNAQLNNIPELWAIDPAGGEAELLGALAEFNPGRVLVMSLDWAPDGSAAAFTIDPMTTPFGGLWLFETADMSIRPLVIPPERSPTFINATFSPDGRWVLLLSVLREMGRNAQPFDPENNGYFVVSADTGSIRQIQSDRLITSAGWTPESLIVYTAIDLGDDTDGGLFATAPHGDEHVKLVDIPAIDARPFQIFAPTPQQYAPIEVSDNGRLLLATATETTLSIELSAD